MKTSKTFSILQAVPMMLQVVLMTLAPLAVFTRLSVIGVIILSSMAAVSGVASTIIALIGSISKKGSPPVFTTLLVKVFSLPFYIFSCTFWLLLALGMLNPFLMLGIPLELAIGLGSLYVYTLGTNMPLIIYAIVFKFRYKSKVTVSLVLSIICLFFLVFDYIGLGIYMMYQKRWFPEHFLPVDEAKRKKIKKVSLIVIAIFVIVSIALTTAFRLSPKGSALNLYSKVVTIVHDNKLPGFVDFKDDENGYVISLTHSDDNARKMIIDCYNTFVEEHPYYSKKMGTVTFVFYKYEKDKGGKPIVITTNGSKID